MNDSGNGWRVDQDQVYQSSNVWDGRGRDMSPDSLREGTLRIYQDASEFTDGEFELQVSSEDDDAIGVAVRLADPQHYYLFAMNQQRNYRILARRVGYCWGAKGTRFRRIKLTSH